MLFAELGDYYSKLCGEIHGSSYLLNTVSQEERSRHCTSLCTSVPLLTEVLYEGVSFETVKTKTFQGQDQTG